MPTLLPMPPVPLAHPVHFTPPLPTPKGLLIIFLLIAFNYAISMDWASGRSGTRDDMPAPVSTRKRP